MTIRLIGTVLASLIASTMLASSALAQQPDPGHPRINNVQNYINTQEQNTENAEKSGKISAAQANKDLAHDNRIEGRLKRDESKDHGHITRGEQRRLDHSLNKNHNRRMRQKHWDKHHK